MFPTRMTSEGCAALSKSLRVLGLRLVQCVLWQMSSLRQDFSLCDCPSPRPPSSTALRFLAEYACVFCFCFPETDPHILLVFQASWKKKKTYKTGSWYLIWRVLRTRSIYFKPFVYATFVVDAQTRQPRYGVALLQVFQANCTLPGVFTQDILIIGYSWLC